MMGSAQRTSGAATGTAGGVRDGVSSTAQRVEDQVVGRPLAAGLIAFGAGLVLAGLVPASEAETRAASKVKDAAQKHGQPVVDEVKAAAQDVGDSLKETGFQAAQEVAAEAQDSTVRVKEQATTTEGQRTSSEI